MDQSQSEHDEIDNDEISVDVNMTPDNTIALNSISSDRFLLSTSFTKSIDNMYK